MKKEEKGLTSTLEDYLEAISMLKKQKGVVRVKDISRILKVKSPTVNSALRALAAKGLAVHEKYGYINFTPKGERIAEAILKRHNTLSKFLIEVLKVNPRAADKDACKMEHSVSPQTFKRIAKFIEFVNTCPQNKEPAWLKSFSYFIKSGRRPKCKIRPIKQKMAV